MRILLLDNYDSFTFNLVHYLEGLDCTVDVIRNDEIEIENISKYDKVVLSPGPGLPKESGRLTEVIAHTYGKKAILGVCLGFQAIIEHFGGTLYNQEEVKHGVAENCSFRTSSRLFKGLPTDGQVGLYHSWAAIRSELPEALTETATSENGVTMAFEDKEGWLAGVQFHPESIMTPQGKEIVHNFLSNFN